MSEYIKTTGPTQTNVTTYRTRTSSGGTVTIDNSFSALQSFSYWFTNGYNTPDFAKRVAKGELIPFTKFRQLESSLSCSGTYSDKNNSTGASRVYDENYSVKSTDTYVYINGFPDFVSQYEEEASYYVQKAAAGIYESGWDGLTFVAELHKLHAMFKNVVERLLRYLRSGKFESIWLESRYGWRILAYDIQDIMKLANSLDDTRQRYRNRVGGYGNYHAEDNSHTVSWVEMNFTQTVVDDFNIAMNGNVVADIKPPPIRFNVVSTAWELITFSFVIDWVINFGQWLSSLSFLVLQSHYTASGGLLVIGQRTSSVTNMVPKSPFTIYSHTRDTVNDVKINIRAPQAIPYTPLLQLRLDWIKVVDILALLAQALRRS
jgi:hypothetical protein